MGSERLGFWGPRRSGGGDMERTSGAWRQVQRVAGRGREEEFVQEASPDAFAGGTPAFAQC